MGNKSRTLAAPADVQMNPQATAAMDESVDTLAALQAGYAQERDLVNQLLGQAQMADAISKLTATVAVSKMAYVKENKLYRQLVGVKNRDGRGLTGTWEEFCELLGTSAPKVNEDIVNLQSFGEAALESMSRMGIGYRELRQYRRLGGDQQQALIAAAKAGDKGEFLDLAEELDALKLRLIELNGTEEQVAAARRERDEAEVRRQIKLAEIEAARAAARNDEGEIAKYREEIALLGEQLTLLGKVYAAEQKQRAAKARGDEGGSGGGGGGVSAGPATMNVTLNANGISDPVKLARMIEPELARLQRLAR